MKENNYNIIFITIDCLRADHVSENISPNISKLANKGCVFNNAIATGSWTPASFKSIFASVYPFNNKGDLSIENNGSFTEIIKNNGYKTIAIQDNPWLSKMYGYGKGFDFFEDTLTLPKDGTGRRNKLIKSLKNIYIKLDPRYKFSFVNIFANIIYAVLTKQHTKTAEYLTQSALDILKNIDQPFFMWIHYLDAHEPYYPHVANVFQKIKYARLNDAVKDCSKMRKSDVNLLHGEYINKIKYIDTNVSSILDFIENSELHKNTYVVLTADHGQQFFEHGDYGHGLSLYEELIHVPLIFNGPNIKKVEVENVFSHINLAPTILGLLEIKANSSFMGQNLSDLLVNSSTDNAESINPFAISEEGRNQRSTPGIDTRLGKKYMRISCRTDDWKYIFNTNASDELYNLKDDPMEEINVVGEQEDVCIKLNSLINQHIEHREEHEKNCEKNKIRQTISRIKKQF